MSYTEREKDEIFRGQCFNNASVILAGFYSKEAGISTESVYELAKQLYDMGNDMDWRHYGKKANSSQHEQEKALTEGSNHLTDKEGKELDPDFKNKELIM